MNGSLARTLFRAWPFSFGHVRIMEALAPPRLAEREVTTNLRRYGLKFRYDPNSYIGQYVYYRGIFEEKILRTIEECLLPGDTFVDVGANIGLHTVVAAKLIGPQGRVIAFEPQSMCRARVLQNISLNDLQNVKLHPYAVGREPGTAKIYNIDGSNDGQATLRPERENCPHEDVSVVPLDSMAVSDCVMKIDVEGAEMEVIRGAWKTLQEQRARHVFVEVVDSYLARFGSSRREVLQALQNAGYTLRGLIRGRWVPVSPDTPQDMDVWASV